MNNIKTNIVTHYQKIKYYVSKKWKIILAFLIPILIVGGVFLYFLFNNSINNKNNKTDFNPIINNNKINKNEVFPDLEQSDFYNLTRIENGKAILTNKMISTIISDIFKRIKKTNGILSFDIEKISKSKSNIHFKWSNNGNIVKKIYSISLNKI